MSQVKKFGFGIILLISLMSFFMFGCEKSTPVNDVFFNFGESKQIVLVVDQELEMGEYVEVRPNYATNKAYAISSLNEKIVRVENNKLIAVAEGVTQIKLVADENNLKQDLITVVVKKTKETLNVPGNVNFNSNTQLFTFDMVPYATSYTLKVNGIEFELGNSNVFDLNTYQGNKFDELLYVQVKANAPKYTYALESSSFSNEFKVYQAGDAQNLKIENGVLTFEKTRTALKSNVYINDNLFIDSSSVTNVDLKNLDETYAGFRGEISVQTIVSDEIKNDFNDNQIHYFNGKKQVLDLNVLDVPVLKATLSTLSWQNIAYASGYEIYVNGSKEAELKNNFYNLDELNVSAGDVKTIRVEPIIENTIGVGKTTKQNSINISRLAGSSITCDGKKLTWGSVDKAKSYSLLLSGEGISDTTSTTSNHFSMENYPAGNYSLKIKAIAGEVEGENIYYLSSHEVTKTFVKNEQVNAQINNYHLNISNLGTSDCVVQFDKLTIYNETLTNNNETAIVDLGDYTKYSFTPELHTITLVRKGYDDGVEDTVDSVDSDPFEVTFTQLEEVTDFEIDGGVAKVVRSSINQNANIVLQVKGAKEFRIDNLQNNIYEFDTTSNSGSQEYLNAGNYTAEIYVEGDGSSTFSVKQGENLKLCASANFEVLPAPIVNLKSTSESKLVVGKVTNATSYDIYSVEGATKTHKETVAGLEWWFNLGDGQRVQYVAQAIGNGSTKLNSTYSDIITIERLQKPTLTYNNATEVVSKFDPNGELSVNHEFKVNGEVEPYDFASKIHFTEDVELTLTSLAVSEKEGVYYLNSNPGELSLTKISNNVNFVMNSLSNLEVEHVGVYTEYDLEVVFTLTSGELKLWSNNGVLTNGKTDSEKIELDYSHSATKYTITLIEDYNAIINEMNDGFSVKVRFIQPSTGEDVLINSEYSKIQSLHLVKINNATTFADIENKQIVIKPENHTTRYGLVVVFNDDEDLTFKSKENKLVSNKGELAFTYNGSEKTYYINIVNDNYEYYILDLTLIHSIKVQYTHLLDATSSDLDSDFTANKSLEVLPVKDIIRDNQTLKINRTDKPTFTHVNYGLLVNDYANLITFESNEITENGNYLEFDVELIYSKTPLNNLQEINEIKLVVFNNEETEINLELLNVSNSIFIQKANTITLSYSKNNDTENNSAVISFNRYTSEYDKEYIVQIFNETNKVQEIIFDDDVEGEIISFSLDNIIYNLIKEGIESETIKICAVVNTNKDYTEEHTIYVFNSIKSNEIQVGKVEEVSDLGISNSVLTFTPVANAVGYELYEKTGTGYTKLEIPMFTAGEYEFTTITERIEIAIKSISNTNNLTNSMFSESFVIDKIDNPIVAVENGMFKITLPSDVIPLLSDHAATVTLETTNHQGEVLNINLKDIPSGMSLTDNILTIQPNVLMCYNTASLVAENIKTKIIVEYSEPIEDVYYLNSNKITTVAYGLMAPTEVEKRTENNASVEFLTWKPSDKNTIDGATISVGYVFKIEYDGTSYYSNDQGLKYEYNSNFVSYESVITTNKVSFPIGYDEGNDGTLDVVFSAGIYYVSVKTVPNNAGSSYNICYSQYSTSCEFEILEETTTAIQDGILTWNGQKTNSYRVSVYKNNDTAPLVSEIVETPEYGFLNNSLKSVYGVLRVVVQALGNRNDILNGAESEPVYVYRLREATSVRFDDGNVVLNASPMFAKAKLEFVDTVSSTTIFEKTYNNSTASNLILQELGIESWEGFSNSLIENYDHEFAINKYDTTLNFFDGRDYSVRITLYGNSDSALGLINSSVAITNNPITATKLKPSVLTASKGVIKFMPDSKYATVEGNTYSGNNINYAFNSSSASAFWKETTVYKINLTLKTSAVDIYAVDYYSFITAIENKKISSSEYEILDRDDGLYAVVKYPYNFTDGDNVAHTGTLYFNVYASKTENGYEGNSINLRDNTSFGYYPIEKIVDRFGLGYLKETILEGNSNVQVQTIDLDGGMFEFKVSILGGDNYTNNQNKNIGYLTSNASESQLIIKYSSNTLTTKDGKVQFENKVMVRDDNGVAFDHPIYKLNVVPAQGATMVFYLYYEDEQMAKEVAEAHDKNTFETARFVKVEELEDNKDFLLFNLSEYVETGTYTVNIRTLASNESSAGNFINAVEPGGEQTNVYYKLSETQFAQSNGALQFNLSYYLMDAIQKPYYNYEVTLYDTVNDLTYVYNINELSDGVKVEGNKFIYTLPNQILVDGKPVAIAPDRVYEIKIRALSEDESILNGTYLKVSNSDVVLTFKKSLGISGADDERMRVENGVLKWKILDMENYLGTEIKVSFLDENFQTKTIIINTSTAVYDNYGAYQYHYYDFTNERYSLQGATGVAGIYNSLIYNLAGGAKEEREIIYTIELIVKGKSKEEIAILNSNSSMIENVYRLSSVDENSVRTTDGILTWNTIKEDVLDVEDIIYEIIIDGEALEESIKIISPNNSLDVLNELDLPVGAYSVNVRAIAKTLESKINSRWLESNIEGFVQLDKVDLSSVKIEGQNIVWNAVEHAQGYRVVFNYIDLDGVEQTIEKDVSQTNFETPANKVGEFKIEISAIGVGDGKLFNGESIVFESTDEVPLPVESLSFDSATNQFVVEVNTEDEENPFTTGDVINIVYAFKPSQEFGFGEETKEIIEIHYNGNSTYYHQLTEMGEYFDIYAQVVRANTAPSNSVSAPNVNYHLFAYGNGTESNPYRISSAYHLLNIKYFPHAHYELTQSIDVSSVDANSQIAENGALIASEFSGVLNGNNKAIVGNNTENLIINIENQTSFALFGSLIKVGENNPTIKNLTIGSNDFDFTIRNYFNESFDFTAKNDVKLSLIASTANNAVIDNVKLIRVKMSYEHYNNSVQKTSGSLHIGGMFKEITNQTIITNSYADVEISVNAKINENVDVYIAGVATMANSSNIGKTQDGEQVKGVDVNFKVVTNTANLFDYVGGLISNAEGTNANKMQIKNSTVDFIVENSSLNITYVGGLIGVAKFAEINNCETTGSYSKSNIGNSIYLGGLIGFADSVHIIDSGTLIEFNISISNTNNKFIGAIVGYISISAGSSSQMNNCYYSNYTIEKTNLQGGLTIGMYGDKASNVIISGCYKKNEQ